MKNYLIIFIVFILIPTLFAQDDKAKNPNVELPDFVITGSDLISIQKGKKIEPDILPIISERSLKPIYSPEDLKISELSDPIKNQFSLTDSLNYFTGKLETGAGIYTLPKLDFTLSSPFQNGIIQVFARAKNSREFVDYSDHYHLNGGINVFYQLEDDSKFLNGTKFQFHGDYGRSAYKLYAARDPFIKRNLNRGNVSLKIENLLEHKFNYTVNFTDDIYSLQDNVYSENFIKMRGIFRANFKDINFGLNAVYKVQYLKNDIVQKSIKDFISIKPTLGFFFSDYLKASVGINYSNYSDQDKVYPYFFVGSKINNRISLFAEYAPEIIFIGSGNFLDMNRYFYLQNFVSLFYEKKNSFQISAKYDFDKYYEINGGMKYFSSSAIPYFSSSALEGRFNVITASAKSYTGFINLIFHLGPYGFLYGSFELNQTKTSDGYILPYHPSLNSALSYGYNFKFGLSSELKLNYLSKQYTDLLNTNSLNPLVNLTVNFIYKLSPEFNLTFEVNNLLNRKDYRWFNYQEQPLDFMAGLIYRW